MSFGNVFGGAPQDDGQQRRSTFGGAGARLGMRLLPIIIGLIAIAVFYFQHRQPGPFGRSQVVGLSQAEEKALGAQSFQEVLRQADVVPQGPVVDVVKQIARNLIAASQVPEVLEYVQIKPVDFQWEVRVVRSRDINAFCLPGGKIVVYTGILPVAQTEAALAAVMGHEIAHALAHHGAERMAQNKMVQMGQMAAAGAAGNDPAQQRQVMAVLGAGAKFGILLPFSRSHESEADRIGMILMAQAGYDPKQAIAFWMRMAKATKAGGKPPEFMSTHPADETRIRDLENLQEEAMQFYSRAPRKIPDRRLPLGQWDQGF